MLNTYHKNELLEMGFDTVGDNVSVSKDARLFAIKGRLEEGVRVDAFSILTGTIVLGAYVHISPFCFLAGTGGMIEMGENAGLSSHVSIFTKSADYTTHQLEHAEKVVGNVYIGKNSIIGAGSKIMPNVKIADNVSVACNSVINQDITEGSIIINRGMGLITVSQRA